MLKNDLILEDQHDGDAKVYKFHWKATINATRQLIEIDAILMDSSLWKERPESADPNWSVRKSGPLILALNIVG